MINFPASDYCDRPGYSRPYRKVKDLTGGILKSLPGERRFTDFRKLLQNLDIQTQGINRLTRTILADIKNDASEQIAKLQAVLKDVDDLEKKVNESETGTNPKQTETIEIRKQFIKSKVRIALHLVRDFEKMEDLMKKIDGRLDELLQTPLDDDGIIAELNKLGGNDEIYAKIKNRIQEKIDWRLASLKPDLIANRSDLLS